MKEKYFHYNTCQRIKGKRKNMTFFVITVLFTYDHKGGKECQKEGDQHGRTRAACGASDGQLKNLDCNIHK